MFQIDMPTILHLLYSTLVPLTQSTAMIDKLECCGVECKLIVKAGKGHLWLGIDRDIPAFVDWFDRHLLGDTISSVRR